MIFRMGVYGATFFFVVTNIALYSSSATFSGTLLPSIEMGAVGGILTSISSFSVVILIRIYRDLLGGRH